MVKTFILVVDDDEDICFFLGQVFKTNNFFYCTVNSINEAKSALSQVKPTHIVLDNNLPDGKGSDFIDFISRNYPEIKIILCSGEENIDTNHLKGLVYILKKPFNLTDLTETIKS